MKDVSEKLFNKNGYLNFKNFLSKIEKNKIKEIIFESFNDELNLLSKKKFSIESNEFHKKLISLRKKNPKLFSKIYDNFKLNANLRSIFYSKKFMKKFSNILGISENKIFLNGFMLRFDAPNDKRNSLDWHQDSPYYEMNYPQYNSGVCWLSITQNSYKNGTLNFIPRSHKSFVKSKNIKGKALNSEQFKLKINKEEKKNIKNMNQNFGDVSFMHMNLKHKSGVNKSNKMRITLGCRFHDMQNSFNSGIEIFKFIK